MGTHFPQERKRRDLTELAVSVAVLSPMSGEVTGTVISYVRVADIWQRWYRCIYQRTGSE